MIPDKSLTTAGFQEGVRDGSVAAVKWHYGLWVKKLPKPRPGKDATIVLFR